MKKELLGALFLAAAASLGAQSLPSNQRTNGDLVEEAFEPIRQRLQESSAVLYDGRTKFIYGTVVSEDGYLLTKASELDGHENITVRIGSDVYENAQVMSRDVVWDLALLKVDARHLITVPWAADSALPQGTWVVSNGSTSRARRRMRAGIISANSREIDGAASVILGVGIDHKQKGALRVTNVGEESGAAKAGIEKGDLITEIDGSEVQEFEDLLNVLKRKQPGDSVPLGIRRGEKNLQLDVELTARPEAENQGVSRNERMSGRISERRDSFPRVLQHETMLAEEAVGGPLFNLDGQCVGINIACANRVESFAIPAEEARSLAENMIRNAREIEGTK